jgi:mRNA-degrading endonuclease YafQ of YafQ-DinJ toxin-antitoxin module
MRRHPYLDNQVADVLKRLQTNPFEPSLRLHSLSGNLSGKQAVSITYAYRIVLCVEIVDKEIILYNIGTHDEVYG